METINSNCEEKKCERCKEKFECFAKQGKDCECEQITISEDALEYIQQNWGDCLCHECLKEINEGFAEYKKAASS